MLRGSLPVESQPVGSTATAVSSMIPQEVSRQQQHLPQPLLLQHPVQQRNLLNSPDELLRVAPQEEEDAWELQQQQHEETLRRQQEAIAQLRQQKARLQLYHPLRMTLLPLQGRVTRISLPPRKSSPLAPLSASFVKRNEHLLPDHFRRMKCVGSAGSSLLHRHAATVQRSGSCAETTLFTAKLQKAVEERLEMQHRRPLLGRMLRLLTVCADNSAAADLQGLFETPAGESRGVDSLRLDSSGNLVVADVPKEAFCCRCLGMSGLLGGSCVCTSGRQRRVLEEDLNSRGTFALQSVAAAAAVVYEGRISQPRFVCAASPHASVLWPVPCGRAIRLCFCRLFIFLFVLPLSRLLYTFERTALASLGGEGSLCVGFAAVLMPLQPYEGAYKKTKGKRWTEEETRKFYECLSCCGTDLLLISTMMPGVTDGQLKRKLKTEEKRNAALVEAALAKKRALSLQTYEQLHGTIRRELHCQPFNDSDEEPPPKPQMPLALPSPAGISSGTSNCGTLLALLGGDAAAEAVASPPPSTLESRDTEAAMEPSAQTLDTSLMALLGGGF
ncbi:myb-like DNA-binding high mobility group box domain-containing protein [Cyclospora cayetanensis]|uniref:Myb-like DNA-binding high mobility group box domain-containing protein n=1 Tax=Cyclospora cayetanensis TaxID=88456 RepID=A0A1D3CQW5_9EIME|nr:myb-like DNA-binding high mobility group box domain-containing protein [Cyclospora cayetanensis]